MSSTSEFSFGEVRKREILFDNEVKIKTDDTKDSVSHSLHYGDRFIPRRTTNKSTDSCHRLLQLTDLSIPRLFFTDPDITQNFYYYPTLPPPRYDRTSAHRFKDLDWLCKPRQKPKIDVNSSHEFEGFSGTAVGNLIEWANSGKIVSNCENSLLLWNPEEELITKYDFQGRIITLAHHPHFGYLATSNQSDGRNSINVWSLTSKTMLNCFSYEPKSGGFITTLCWNKFGIHLLSGNAQGVISTLDFYGKKKRIHRTSSSTHAMLKDIKFSATGRYVSSLDILGKLCIWSYNGGFLQLHHVWEASSRYVSVDWHPWHDSDLAISSQRGNTITILNVISKQVEAYSTGQSFTLEQPVISFNKVSAELVVACQQKVGNTIRRNVIVLGAIDKVVDEILDVGAAIDTAFMWSPNGEQLAFVAGTDIQIYNFFGTPRGGQRTAIITTTPTSNTVNMTANTHTSIFKEFDYIK